MTGEVGQTVRLYFLILRCVTTWSSPAKVTQLEDGGFRVHQQVLGLDVPVTHTLGMDVGQAAKQLVHVHLKRENDISMV